MSQDAPLQTSLHPLRRDLSPENGGPLGRRKPTCPQGSLANGTDEPGTETRQRVAQTVVGQQSVDALNASGIEISRNALRELVALPSPEP